MKRPSPDRPSFRRPRLQSLEPRRLLAADGLALADDLVDVQQNSSTIEIDVLANDHFDDGYAGQRRITAVSTGSLGGRIEIDPRGHMLRYAPPADSRGNETFRYTVDGIAGADVVVQITSPLPEFQQTLYSFRDEYRLDLLADARFADDYAGDRRITLISETEDGAEVHITDDGKSVVYRSQIGVSGPDQFTYIVDNRFVGTARVDVINPLDKDKYEVLQVSGTTILDVLSNDFIGQADPGVNLAELRAGAQITHLLSNSDDYTVSIRDNGRSIEFTPTPDFVGQARFRYVVDGRFEQSVSVTVQRVVRDDHVEADIDGGVHDFDVLSNDHYDSIFGQKDIHVVDRITEVTQGDQGGLVEISSDGKQILYIPAEGFSGIESIEYVADGKYRAKVTVHVSQPVRNDWMWIYRGTTTPIDVLGNDFRGDAASDVTITSVGSSSIGATIEISQDGFILYTPPDDPLVFGESFEYAVNDQYTASVVVNLRSITERDTYHVDRPDLMELDVLRNDNFNKFYSGPAVITAVSDPTRGGTASIAADGKRILYRPGHSVESFTYTVDGRFTETIRVYPIPWLKHDRAVADQNGPPIDVPVLINDFTHSSIFAQYGAYQGQRNITSVSEPTQGGTVQIDGAAIRYQPPPEFIGRDTFTYTVDDFLTQTVAVNVVRRAADDLVRVAIDSESNVLNVLGNDILGADYQGFGLVTAVSESSAGGVVSVAPDGRSVLYQPPDGFVGPDNFVYTVDGYFKATVTVVVQDDPDGLLSQIEEDELRDLLLAKSIERYGSYFGRGGSPEESFDYSQAAVLSALDSERGLDFSETNVQFAGVDEADLVETDGNFIYSLRDDRLMIVKSLPAEQLELLSQTAIEGTPIGMYLSGDRLTVISKLTSDPPVIPYLFSDLLIDIDPRWYDPTEVTTIVTVFDVADRASPQVVQRTTFDADYTDSRRIDDQVFLVLGSQNLLIEPEMICDTDGENCVYETEEEFVDRVNRDFASLIEEILPAYESYDAGGNLVRGGPLLLPEDIFRSLDDASSMTIVVSLNMASDEPGLAATSGVMADAGSTIYATAENLYVFNPHREAIENEPWTRILKFNWDGLSGAIDFAAVGDVPGMLLDQFSVDEHDGMLRVTTEISNQETGNFSGQNETALFVLEDDVGALEFLGRLQNLALGHEVKSVRYFGDTAMVTTFPERGQRVDPLYAVDLSDPAAPRVLGHVPIPGFNSYMQFIAPDRLLTVGVNSATGWGGRAMVSLFDVSDMTSPSLVDQYNLPRFSTSIANSDHHAFGWFARHELLAVPISRYYAERFDEDGDGYPEAFRSVREDALSMLHVGIDPLSGEEGIWPRGQLEHSAQVLRSVYVNRNIYSIGLDGVRTVHVDDPGTVVSEVVFPDEPATVVADRTRYEVDELRQSARQILALQMNVDPGSLTVVAHQSRGGVLDVVMRRGDRHYRYRGADAHDLALADEDFRFVDQWHNRSMPNDVNGDGDVTAADALGVINEMARRAGSALPVDRVLRQIDAVLRFADTNGDGRISALDALRIINQMARVSVAAAGEQTQPLLFQPAGSRKVDIMDDHEPRGSLRALF